MTTISETIDSITISCMAGYCAEMHDDKSLLEWARAISAMTRKYIHFYSHNLGELSITVLNETPYEIEFTIKGFGGIVEETFTTSSVREEIMIEAEILSKIDGGLMTRLLAIEEKLE